MANWLTQQQRPGLVQPGAGVRATHSSAGLLLRVRHFPSTPPSTLPSCGLLPAQEQALFTARLHSAWGKGLPAEAPELVGSPGTHGGTESSQPTWQA